jgi:hypothetical protein
VRWLWFVVVLGCVSQTPPGFPAGQRWTFSLVDPLADERLIAPVYIDGRGPFLFVLDPEAPRTIVDPELVPDDALRFSPPVATGSLIDRPDMPAGLQPNRRGRSAAIAPFAELEGVRVGDLTLDRLHVQISSPHAFDAGGRRLRGVLGRDVLARSLVFGFDRDRGVAWLEARRMFHPPVGAHAISLDDRAAIGDVEYDVSVDLGRVESRFDLPAASAPLQSAALASVDELGVAHRIERVAIAPRITFGGITRTGFLVAPTERGARLGLGFFASFSVSVDWPGRLLYLATRKDDRQARLGRWGALVPRCVHAGCASFELRGTRLTARPDAAGVDLQLVIRAVAPSGGQLPTLELSLPAGSPSVTTELPSSYTNASLELLDVSPFPRSCAGARACVIAG